MEHQPYKIKFNDALLWLAGKFADRFTATEERGDISFVCAPWGIRAHEWFFASGMGQTAVDAVLARIGFAYTTCFAYQRDRTGPIKGYGVYVAPLENVADCVMLMANGTEMLMWKTKAEAARGALIGCVLRLQGNDDKAPAMRLASSERAIT